jgi:hypothetical protein
MDIDIKLLKCFLHDSMDINKLSELGYDNQDQQFIRNFKQLCDLNLITTDSYSCGLHLSADNRATWTCIDLRLTEKGNLLLLPPQVSKLSILNKVTSHPIVSGVCVVGIIAVISFGYTFLGNDQESNQDMKLQQPNKSKLPSKTP